ncbi:MAG TPA: hypothetical protein VM327_07455 [Candidatus Thermoplasmatota archaeon]|nr:hypothetical protein [Candidatus Thermoplasmatota archaeon]
MKPWIAILLVVPALAAAGCATDGDDMSAPSSSSATGSSPDLDGVVLEIIHTGAGEDHRLDATVRNTGLRIVYFLWVPQCGLEPWHDGMVGPGGKAVQPREPEAHCLPCGWDALSPGESLSKSFEWDERLWDFDEERPYAAPDGRYVWTVTFQAEPDEDDVCGGQRAVSASIELHVD